MYLIELEVVIELTKVSSEELMSAATSMFPSAVTSTCAIDLIVKSEPTWAKLTKYFIKSHHWARFLMYQVSFLGSKL